MLTSDKNISERLEKVRLALNLRKGAMANKLGISPGDYSKFFPSPDDSESRRKPATLVIELLNLGVNANWYLTGIGEMFLSDSGNRNAPDPRIEKAGRLLREAVQLILEEIEDGGGIQKSEPEIDRAINKVIVRRIVDQARNNYASGPALEIPGDRLEDLKRLR
ncbi:MAG: helix-turn-helix transcriptional regulator [Chlorobiaceae bacterium]|nr:helix-turn-helix transcriptional regulator [Chlorobiaceae bacterium]